MCAASTCPTFLHSTSRTALLVCNSYCSHVRSRLLKVIDTLLLFFTIIIFVSSCSSYMGIHLKMSHDDVIKWKHFPRYWPFVREIHRSPVNFPHKGQWRGALMFTLICARMNGWVNNREAGDLRRYLAHYDVIVMGGCHYHRNDSFFHKIHVYSLTSGWCSNNFKRAILKHFYHLLSWAILWYYPQVNTTLMTSLH